ncbi:type II secretion system F family protein [Candidatus Pacearchaeota archaeon]|nr:type II secretion system F family protein [Candidatus Pacearchaeota archaeon]
MTLQKTNPVEELKKVISKEKIIIKEISLLSENLEKVDEEEKQIVFSQINQLKNSLREVNKNLPEALEKVSLVRPLHPQPKIQPIVKPIQKRGLETSSMKLNQKEDAQETKKFSQKILSNSNKKEILKLEEATLKLEKVTLKRLKIKKEKIAKKKVKKANKYIRASNKFFSNYSLSLLNKKVFKHLEEELIKTNLQFITPSYVSILLFTTFLSVIAAIFIFLFFLFFNLGFDFPFITSISESLGSRFLKVFWLLFIIPIGTFLFMYFYPSLEKKSLGNKIDQELPFATINMSAISGSMINPSEIFKIIILTKEYPNLEKEFTKLINEINIYGYDLVTALKKVAENSPSKKLAELFNGLATTINSGGDLPEFFEKRSQTLLFEYRIEREKYTKFSETFMDIYISAVIAAPMILMLVLMMMKISGLGIALSTSMITIIMVMGVSVVNIVFLTFLHLKQPVE